jgi:hypothetical protein
MDEASAYLDRKALPGSEEIVRPELADESTAAGVICSLDFLVLFGQAKSTKQHCQSQTENPTSSHPQNQKKNIIPKKESPPVSREASLSLVAI